MYKEFEENVRKAQSEVPRTVPVQGSAPYPVYRPSKSEIVWVNSIDDVMFVALGETFIAKADTAVKHKEHFENLGLVDRILYNLIRK